MSEPFFPRDQVARQLVVEVRVLRRYEARGLLRAVKSGDAEGYGPGEVRRLWSILSLQRDLGVNLAGVEAILHLRAHVDDLHRRLEALAGEMRAALEADREPDVEP